MGYYVTSSHGTTMDLQVRPRAGKNRIVGLVGERLKVELKAPDEGGKANEALVKFLAKKLGVSAGDITILTGKKARKKTLLVTADLDHSMLEDLAQGSEQRRKQTT